MVPSATVFPHRRATLLILVTVTLDMLAVGLFVPVLPKLILMFSAHNYARSAQISGYYGAIWSLMQFIFSPILGGLSDRYGRRRIILISNFGVAASYVMIALAPDLIWLLVGRIIGGIMAASITTAGAYISDTVPVERRAAGFGLLGAAFGFGFILGPVMGGWLGDIDIRLPFWVAAGFSLTNGLFSLFVLPESLPREKRIDFSWTRANPVGSLSLLRSNATLAGLACVHFLDNLARQSLPAIFVQYALFRYHWSSKIVGLTLAGVGLGSMIVQGGLVQHVVRLIGERRTLIVGLSAGCVSFVLMGMAADQKQLWFSLPVFAFWGLGGPAAQALMTRSVSPSVQGQLQGALQSLVAFTGLFGPLLFTQSFAYFIGTHAPMLVPGAPFFIASGIIGIAIILSSSLFLGRQPVDVSA